MKSYLGSKIRLGLFISIGITAFIIGIYLIGQRQNLFRGTFRISGVFEDVAGLQAGNMVRLSGVNVGTVDLVSIVSDTSVNVELVIDDRAREFIRKDAIISIGSEGLMGNKLLIITPGTGNKQLIEDGNIVQTNQPVNLDEVFSSLKTTIDNTSNIIGNLSRIAASIQSGNGTIGRLIMDPSLAQNIDSTIVNLRQGSDGFKELLDDVTDGFAQINITDILLSLKTTMDNTSQITGDVALLTRHVQSGEGTIGKLIKDDSLRLNIDSTVIYLKEGTKGFKTLMNRSQESWLMWGSKKEASE